MPTDLPPDYKPRPVKPGEGKPLPEPPGGGEDVKGYPPPGGKVGGRGPDTKGPRPDAPDAVPAGIPSPADMPTF